MENNDRMTTIQIRSSTRDRLYRLKFRKTYDEYLGELIDIAERLERDGEKKRRDPKKLKAMIKASRDWARKNVVWENGMIVEVDLNG
ncbi:MAG: hypothetical protein QCI82_01245 [Candidatus Thermoplasmatota archaeon]|nr:hypothetical protein [Candidatus Thermoplasmatota archaeon]